MANNNDERGDESAKFVRIDSRELAQLFAFTGQDINFEDHGDFAVVDAFDLELLESYAMDLAMGRLG